MLFINLCINLWFGTNGFYTIDYTNLINSLLVWMQVISLADWEAVHADTVDIVSYNG